MLPGDTITFSHLQEGPTGGTVTIEDCSVDECTILGVAFDQGNIASDTDVLCGADLIYRNFATQVPYVDLNSVCSGILGYTKTGNDDAFFTVNYVTRNTAASSPDIPAAPVQDFSVAMGLGFIIFILMLKVGNDMVRK